MRYLLLVAAVVLLAYLGLLLWQMMLSTGNVA